MEYIAKYALDLIRKALYEFWACLTKGEPIRSLPLVAGSRWCDETGYPNIADIINPVEMWSRDNDSAFFLVCHTCRRAAWADDPHGSTAVRFIERNSCRQKRVVK